MAAMAPRSLARKVMPAPATLRRAPPPSALPPPPQPRGHDISQDYNSYYQELGREQP